MEEICEDKVVDDDVEREKGRKILLMAPPILISLVHGCSRKRA